MLGGGGGESVPAKPGIELLEDLNESINLIAEFLRKHNCELSQIITERGFAKNAVIAQAKEIINQNDETRKRFEIMARGVFSKFKACINVVGINDLRDAINVLYKSLQADKEKADISSIMKKLYEIVDASIDTTTYNVKEPNLEGSRIYDISQSEISVERWAELDKHFDEESELLEKSIDTLLANIESEKKTAHSALIIDQTIFYSKFHPQLIALDSRLKAAPIIWIDDPISSLDGNHIFFIYSLLNAEVVEKGKFAQLFVSTHNLDFLKYLKRLKDNYLTSEGER